MHPDEMKSAERVSSRLPISEQEKCIAELHETISILTDRLKPVLTPTPEVDRNATEDRPDGPVFSPLATQLEANNGGIRKATRKLSNLLERLEC